MEKTIKILFVCHGNICRSTMAQSVLAHMVKEKGIENRFYIDSAATSTEEIGNPPHRGTVAKLRQVGIPLVPHRATQVTKADYAKYDYLLCMDDANVRNTTRICGGDPEGKIIPLLSFAGISRSIADPWYTGNFDATYDDVVLGLTHFLDHIKDEL